MTQIIGTSLFHGYSKRPIVHVPETQKELRELHKAIGLVCAVFPEVSLRRGSPGNFHIVTRNTDYLEATEDEAEILKFMRKVAAKEFEAEWQRYEDAKRAEEERLAKKQAFSDKCEKAVQKRLKEKRDKAQFVFGIGR